jgi:IS30 family transposase
MGKQYSQLDLDERIELSRLYEDGIARSEIAKIMGCHASTIGRELRRNNLPKGGYKPASADRIALSRCRRSSRIERLSPLRDHIDDHLPPILVDGGWSPEQIAGRLRLLGSQHRVSHEPIYRTIYRPKVRGKKLYRYLPRTKACRRRRYFKRRRQPIPRRRSIHERGQAIESRETFGHWEGDTLQFGTQRGCLITGIFAVLPEAARRSITFDNGSEFARHQDLKDKLDMESFFCDPHSPWQRGAVENANGILRRDLPRKTDLTDPDIQNIVWAINITPRKCLGFLTPAEAFLHQLRYCTDL